MPSLRRQSLLCLLLLAIMSVAGCQHRAFRSRRIQVSEAPPCSNQSFSSEAVFTAAKRGVAVVTTDSAQGSAFVVSHQDGSTMLITNSHVVEGSRSATVKWSDGEQDNAAVLRDAGGFSPQTDLALLEVKAVRGKVLGLKVAKPNVGADIVAIGNPEGLEFSLTSGVVSSLRDDGDLLQLDAPINPGNSGGPVLDRTGCVVGVATFKISDSEGLNFAVASSLIQNFLAKPSPRWYSPSNPGSRPPFNPSNPGSAGNTCWFQMRQGAQRLVGFRCSIIARKNVNGHTVFDIVEPGGLTRTVILWDDDKSVEVLLNGSRYIGQWDKDEDDDFRVTLDDGVFIFRYRG